MLKNNVKSRQVKLNKMNDIEENQNKKKIRIELKRITENILPPNKIKLFNHIKQNKITWFQNQYKEIK